jgi:hypothetical protein
MSYRDMHVGFVHYMVDMHGYIIRLNISWAQEAEQLREKHPEVWAVWIAKYRLMGDKYESF